MQYAICNMQYIILYMKCLCDGIRMGSILPPYLLYFMIWYEYIARKMFLPAADMLSNKSFYHFSIIKSP